MPLLPLKCPETSSSCLVLCGGDINLIFSSEEDKDRYQANLSAEEDSLPVPQSVRGKPSPLSKLAIRIKWVDFGRGRRRTKDMQGGGTGQTGDADVGRPAWLA